MTVATRESIDARLDEVIARTGPIKAWGEANARPDVAELAADIVRHVQAVRTLNFGTHGGYAVAEKLIFALERLEFLLGRPDDGMFTRWVNEGRRAVLDVGQMVDGVRTVLREQRTARKQQASDAAETGRRNGFIKTRKGKMFAVLDKYPKMNWQDVAIRAGYDPTDPKSIDASYGAKIIREHKAAMKKKGGLSSTQS